MKIDTFSSWFALPQVDPSRFIFAMIDMCFAEHRAWCRLNDELFGDEIIFLDGGKKVQVLNVKAQIDPERVGRDNREQVPNKGEKP